MREDERGHTEASRRLTVTMRGPQVTDARVSVSDLAEIVGRTQQGLQRVAQVLYGEKSRGAGRKRQEIERSCQLFLIAWQKGSAVAQLELAETPRQASLFGDIGGESLNAFVQGMQELTAGDGAQPHLPRGFDAGVLETCQSLGRVLGHGIDEISYETQDGGIRYRAAYDSPLRERVRELLAQPIETGATTKVGRLETLDGHRELSGRLWEADGTSWLCHFTEEQMDILGDAWMHTVKLAGEAKVEEGRQSILEVHSIVVLDDAGEAASEWDAGAFWHPQPLAALLQRQDVRPVEDLDELGALWPADDDPDELLQHILAERAARYDHGQRQGRDECE